jgi:hypothetical protein
LRPLRGLFRWVIYQRMPGVQGCRLRENSLAALCGAPGFVQGKCCKMQVPVGLGSLRDLRSGQAFDLSAAADSLRMTRASLGLWFPTSQKRDVGHPFIVLG